MNFRFQKPYFDKKDEDHPIVCSSSLEVGPTHTFSVEYEFLIMRESI